MPEATGESLDASWALSMVPCRTQGDRNHPETVAGGLVLTCVCLVQAILRTWMPALAGGRVVACGGTCCFLLLFVSFHPCDFTHMHSRLCLLGPSALVLLGGGQAVILFAPESGWL